MITQDILRQAQQDENLMYIPQLVEPERARAIMPHDRKILKDLVRNLLVEFTPKELENLTIDLIPNDPIARLEHMPSPAFIAAYYRSAGLSTELRFIPEGIFTWPVQSFVSQKAFEYVFLHELVHWTGAASRLARHGVRDGRERNRFLATEEIIASCASIELLQPQGKLDAEVLFFAYSYLQYIYHEGAKLVPLIPHVMNEVERIVTWLRA